MDARRKRLLFRCNHRGTKENDIMLGGFAAIHVNDLTEPQLAAFEALLDESDIELYKWITGKEPVPAAHDHDLIAWLKKFNNCP
ncbi:MAG: succinate dehydrogenase assembly factor 2 [Rhodospirillales bacterium]|nr:succinate dehydrogenase assembly factor 2 [Alphaproteobacteria bacterium]MBL6948783.1 succinate dehydrogenase assembly factor 2 [Rhodospirillales bacterium]